MKIKEFTAFHFLAEEAFNILSADMSSFIKKNKSLQILSISHSIIESKVATDTKRFMASALICYST